MFQAVQRHADRRTRTPRQGSHVHRPKRCSRGTRTCATGLLYMASVFANASRTTAGDDMRAAEVVGAASRQQQRRARSTAGGRRVPTQSRHVISGVIALRRRELHARQEQWRFAKTSQRGVRRRPTRPFAAAYQLGDQITRHLQRRSRLVWRCGGALEGSVVAADVRPRYGLESVRGTYARLRLVAECGRPIPRSPAGTSRTDRSQWPRPRRATPCSCGWARAGGPGAEKRQPPRRRAASAR